MLGSTTFLESVLQNPERSDLLLESIVRSVKKLASLSPCAVESNDFLEDVEDGAVTGKINRLF